HQLRKELGAGYEDVVVIIETRVMKRRRILTLPAISQEYETSRYMLDKAAEILRAHERFAILHHFVRSDHGLCRFRRILCIVRPVKGRRKFMGVDEFAFCPIHLADMFTD